MFDYPGSKIKVLSIILFFLVVIVSVVLACVLGFEGGDFESPALFFGFLIGGSLGAYISSLILCGFGELIEELTSIRVYCKKIDDKLQETGSDDKLLAKGGWKCTCGRTNPSYTTTCACGTNRRSVTSATK